MIWVSYAIFALGSPWGWLGLISPALMLYFLLGAPALRPQKRKRCVRAEWSTAPTRGRRARLFHGFGRKKRREGLYGVGCEIFVSDEPWISLKSGGKTAASIRPALTCRLQDVEDIFVAFERRDQIRAAIPCATRRAFRGRTRNHGRARQRRPLPGISAKAAELQFLAPRC